MVKASASSADASSRSSNAPQSWRPTTIMNMRDLSKDDDFLSHLLVEKLGTGSVPLVVHKMDPSRRLPKTDAADLLRIVHRLVFSKLPQQAAIRRAVDEILLLNAVRYYIKDYTTRQINAFASHALRYFELYHPSGIIEIAHTSRYAHRTGKSELCILATREIAPGTVIQELKGSMADLTDDECRELKRTDLRSSDIRRDFSVIHSKSKKKNHLFLGPARFVNHDCGHNCELIRETRCIAFRVIKPIAVGEEVTAHYGNGYFGRNNRHCLCATCEKYGKGGYSATYEQDISADLSDSDCDTDISTEDELEPVPTIISGLNERRTRRKTYPIVRQIDSEDSGDEVAASLVDNLENTDDSEEPVSFPTPQSPSTRVQDASTSSRHPASLGQAFSVSANLVSTSRQPSLASSTPSPRRSSRLSVRTVSQEPLKLRLRVPQPLLQKEQISHKKEEPESRSRRGRLVTSMQAIGSSQPKKEKPVGKDGKPLPTCSTCENVLPLIAVDSKVVWGLLETSSKGKQKKQDQDCPRCMRHFAIYRQPWPSRIPLRGCVLTPEPSPPPLPRIHLSLNKRTLSTVDLKLAAAAKSQSSNVSAKASEDPPQKRRRIETSTSAPVRHSEAVAQVQTQSQLRPGRYGRKNSIDPTTGRPKRGRPRNRTPSPSPETVTVPFVVKVELDDDDESSLLNLKAEAIKNQPRDGNGRFGKKQSERASHSSRAERASERERKREEADSAAAPAKRGSDTALSDDIEESQSKKSRPIPSSMNNYNLLLRPNPLSFSRRLWSAQGSSPSSDSQSDLIDDLSHSEDSEGLVTPRLTSTSPSPHIMNQEMDQEPTVVQHMKPFRIIKPSPFSTIHKSISTSSLAAVASPDLSDHRSDVLIQHTNKPAEQIHVTTRKSSNSDNQSVLDVETVDDDMADLRTRPIFSALSKTYALPSHKSSNEWTSDTGSATITSVAAFSATVVSTHTRKDNSRAAETGLRSTTPTQDQYEHQARVFTIVAASPTVQLNKAWVPIGS